MQNGGRSVWQLTPSWETEKILLVLNVITSILSMIQIKVQENIGLNKQQWLEARALILEKI